MLSVNHRICHHLMLKADSLENIGLFSGKMGIALAFAEYGKRTKNAICARTFEELLDQVLENVHKGLPFDFGKGLAGIGWGIEYLLQNGFVEGEGVEVCEEIDNFIMRTDPRRINDNSLETGLEGLLHYVLAHIKGAKQRLPFDDVYLNDLATALQTSEIEATNHRLRSLVDIYMNFYNNKSFINYDMNIEQFIVVEDFDSNTLIQYPLGLSKGLASQLLLNI